MRFSGISPSNTGSCARNTHLGCGNGLSFSTTLSTASHLRLSALMALGELPVACRSKRAFQVFPIKHLILHVVPFPKGAPTAPELLAADAASVDAPRLNSCVGWSESGQDHAWAMDRFTPCLAASRSASGAWRRTSTRTITCGSSGHSV